MQIQISLISNKGYRALSTLIEVESWDEYIANKSKWQQYAIVHICAKRYMTLTHLKQYGYNEIRARVYGQGTHSTTE